MPQDPFVPTHEDLGVFVRATVTGKVVGVETGFIDIETERTADGRSAACVRLQHPKSATWERVAPTDWPPQPGDVWGDAGGASWFIYQLYPQQDKTLSCRTATGGYADAEIERHLLNLGPLTLLLRDGKAVVQ
jgi:hypothetical protein